VIINKNILTSKGSAVAAGGHGKQSRQGVRRKTVVTEVQSVVAWVGARSGGRGRSVVLGLRATGSRVRLVGRARQGLVGSGVGRPS